MHVNKQDISFVKSARQICRLKGLHIFRGQISDLPSFFLHISLLIISAVRTSLCVNDLK